MKKSNILSRQEIHQIGINIIINLLENRGYTIENISYDLEINPQLTVAYEGRRLFIFVRTDCYPRKGKLNFDQYTINFIKYANSINCKCYFAAVSVENALGTTDVEKGILLKHGKFYVDCDHLQEMIIPNKKDHNRSQNMYGYNTEGDISVKVSQLDDGRHNFSVRNDSDFNSLIMSLFIVFADDLQTSDQLFFSEWAGLPKEYWGAVHKEKFAIASMHYLLELKNSDVKILPQLRNTIDLLSPQALPNLPKPLTDKIKNIMRLLFEEA